jgi:hypothetical protein
VLIGAGIGIGKFGDDRYGKTLSDKRETILKMS